MNAKKLIMKMAAAFVAAAVFSSTAGAVSEKTVEISRLYYASHGNHKVPLQVDETYQIKFRTDPEAVKYISNDDSVAVVSDSGLITAKNPGSCKIMATYGDDVYWYTVTVPVFQYKIEDDKAIILKYCGKSKKVTIPERIDDKIVTEIAAKAFYKNTSVQTVNIPEDVLKLGKNVFYGCKQLKKVTYKDKTYTKKQLSAFTKAVKEEAKLTASESPISDFELRNHSVYNEFPINEYNIDNYYGNSENVVIPRRYNGLDITYVQGFMDNSKIKSVVIPKTVKCIGQQAFEDCVSLKEVDILGTDVEIRSEAFSGCISLEEIVIPEGTDRISSYAFDGCVSLKKVILPDSLTRINERAFSNCFSLTDLYIPDNIERIDIDAFKGSKNLRLHYKGMVFDPSNKKDMKKLRYYNIIYKYDSPLPVYQAVL